MSGTLSLNLIERIADHADIDTRRAMGFRPRKLPKVDFNPKPMPSIEYRYYVNEKKLWYFEMAEYASLFFEVLTGVELIDASEPVFKYTDDARQILTTYTEYSTRHEDVHVDAPTWQIFQTAGHPIFIAT
jgi:hypothetical protein